MSVPVFVNVYRLIPTEDAKSKAGNDALEFIKMGIYHAGVEILDKEYSFGMDPTGRGDPNTDGVFVCRPRTAAGEFKESVKLGDINIDRDGLNRVLDSLRPQWKAVTYHILNRNCCYFSLELAKTLNPAFEQTFPHYVYRAAGVGGAVVPDAVISSLTRALAPPTSIDSSLINKIDVPSKITPPRPGAARPTKAADAAPASGGLFGMAKGLASQAVSTVKAAVGADDLKVLKEVHPDVNPNTVTFFFNCDVLHVYKEQSAKVFVTDAALCFTGDNKLSLKLPYSNIASLSYGLKVAPATKGLPPTFEFSDSASGADSGLFVWTKDGKLIPLFGFDGGLATSAMAKVTGSTSNPKLDAAFDAVDAAWRKAVRV